ncbi:MAG TPA: hypothetical protein VHV30_06030 [Polyangiaceae bacterium]|nr:hypothetical protein [Polyangiaceae bacterium]
MNKDNRNNRHRQAIVGLQKQYPPTATVVLDGASHTPADIAKAFQASVDAADVTTAAAAAFHKAVADERAANATADTMYRSLRAYVGQASPDVLASFGFTSPSRQVPSADTVAGAVEKRAATRAARHTLGKRQKAGIKGTVTTAPEAPAGSATPPATSATVANPPPAPKPAS